MKKLLLLFIPLMGFFGCEVFDDSDDSPNTSYNCTNDDCFSADGGNGQYATLDDCLSVCGNSGNNNSGPWEFCWEVDVESNFESTYRWGNGLYNSVAMNETYYLTGANTSSTFYPECYSTTVQWTSWHFALELLNENSENGCVNIEIKTLVNDILIQTDNVTFGCISGADGDECSDYCSTYGNSRVFDFTY